MALEIWKCLNWSFLKTSDKVNLINFNEILTKENFIHNFILGDYLYQLTKEQFSVDFDQEHWKWQGTNSGLQLYSYFIRLEISWMFKETLQWNSFLTAFYPLQLSFQFWIKCRDKIHNDEREIGEPFVWN